MCGPCGLCWRCGPAQIEPTLTRYDYAQISSTAFGHDKLYESLSCFIPDLSTKLVLCKPTADRPKSQLKTVTSTSPPSLTRSYSSVDPLSTASNGDDFAGLGCFQIGHDTTFAEFTNLRESQRSLKNLDLLAKVEGDELATVCAQIEVLRGAQHLGSASQAISDLLDLLSTADDGEKPRIKIFSGLHSAFQTASGTQYWGLYDFEPAAECPVLHLSNKTKDRAGVILHTFLSSRQCTRTECFLAEQAMAERNGCLDDAWKLSSRLVQDVEQLSPAEAILLLRRLQSSKYPLAPLSALRDCLEYQLLEIPALAQQRALCSTAYLGGDISAEALVASRLSWLADKGCWIPDRSQAVKLFEEVDARLYAVLMTSQSDVFAQIGDAMQRLVQKDQIDAGVDILALSVFCAFRKLALDEVYLEVLDRNVYPNHAPDQAGCFAENFALGSRCDSFFDTTPRSVGRIIANRYRGYYMKHQPPYREDGFTELPTAYAAMQVDFDPDDGRDKPPFYYQITFFGIFAVPALFDVMLLTTIGRGLYLTTFMTSEQKTMSTTALMLALLMSGAFGAWICSGGSYYFYASTFPAMNLFVLTRFIAGIAFTILVAVGGFIVLVFLRSITAALIFVYYFVMLTTYMLVLNALSIYQLPGSSFLSGRSAIFVCIPILFISPVLTIFTGNDIIVYLPVLSAFLIALLFGARSVIGQWSSWYLKIPFVADAEVVKWYRDSAKASCPELEKMKDNEVMPLARAALHAAVLKACSRWSLFSQTLVDPLVAKLAKGYKSTMFLMRWYCRHKRSRMPLPYSTTWNLTLKAGIENMTNMQKGLKLHSAFLHWRSTGRDIWSGFLYFIVALMDKWVALVTGENIVGLSAASNEEFRLAVGYGLSYYLLGAVLLDIVSQPLWIAANAKTTLPITSLESLQQVTADDTLTRRKLYWKSLVKFFFLHLWGAAAFAAGMWIFQDSRDNTIMFLSYVGAYSGLLWYQYNKIFCGTHGAMPLAFGALAGFPAGLAFHYRAPEFAFGGVISLAIATWVSCFVSLWIAKLGWPTFFASKPRQKEHFTDDVLPAEDSYSVSTLEPHPELSQATMSMMFESARRLGLDKRYEIDPGKHPGSRILELVTQRNTNSPAALEAAFPSAEELVHQASKSWQDGKVIVELVSSRHFSPPEAKIQSISRKSGNSLHVFVVLGPDLVGDEWTLNVHRHWRIIAETMVQAAAQHQLGLTHDDAKLAALLVVDHINDGEISIPEGIKWQLETSSTERARVIRDGDKTLLRHALLGVDCDREWDQLPKPARSFLLHRLCGSTTPLSNDEELWFRERLSSHRSLDLDVLVARFELGATLTRAVLAYANDLEFDGQFERDDSDFVERRDNSRLLSDTESTTDEGKAKVAENALKSAVSSVLHKVKISLKFLILSMTADPEYQRELDYVIHERPSILRWPVVFFLHSVWSYCKFLQGFLVPMVLFHGRDHVKKIQKLTEGMTTVLEKNRIVTESFTGPSTWFWATHEDGSLRLSQYNGRHDREPTEPTQLKAVNTYTNKLVLRQRELYGKGSITNSFRYQYQDGKSRLPLQRECIMGELEGEIVQYDGRGCITTGSAMRGVNRVTWRFWYRKSAKHEDELLWAEYTFPHITMKVLWSMPPRNRQKRLEEWIPFSTVTEATFIQGDDVYHASWDYEHKFHPEVAVTLNGATVATPLMIKEDWFQVLKKPENCSFLSENPLLSFSSIKTNPISRFLGFNVKRYPIPISVARTQLWKAWKGGRQVDAVSARWLDEKLLRSDGIMRPYWRLRDFGRLEAAKAYLDAQADTIMARVDVDPQTSSWTHLAFKISDLYSFGQGGDARINTRKLASQLWDGESELHVLAMDTSTWPNDPGGVSACRRDMVNDLKTVKWHVVAESANDYGVPRFQIERNVQSLTVLPLWGLDFLNPTHGVLETSLDSAVVQRSLNTKTADIVQNFLPILTSLVRCSRAIHLNRQHIEEATRALVNLNTYFETSRNWNDVWKHPVVKYKWRELWLAEDMKDNALNISDWWDFEKPTIQHLDEALNLWCRYLFIFSLPVPEQIPDVFQASHHFTGATYGIVCKVKRNCSLHIWDHCISFREFTTFMSSAVSYDAPFVNSTLISLTHLSCVLLEHHADVVLPCCDYFNPGWEVELGTAEGALEHRRTFARKIDPVVNGICNMEKFEPIKTIKTDKPTVVMLSHIQYVKDIKNAIMATDMIVNKWAFKDYRLHVYGDMERAATIATECQELIASKNLQDHCILKGLGNPSIVLQDAWLFLNSSISEGLPLAMGEAALTGVPVVCTDVGASYCVVTDRATGQRFSEVVPPNDSESLARAQISVLALLGPWSAYAEDEPGADVPVLAYPTPTREQVRRISERMHAKTEQRRALGMRGRQNVLNNFSAERYLREHEQMLWIGKYRSGAHQARLAERDAASAPASMRSSVWIPRPRPVYAARSRPVSRLTPESWVSLSSEETRRGWRSISASTLSLSTVSVSVRGVLREKLRRPPEVAVVEIQSPNAIISV